MMELTQQTILILFAALAAAIFILFILCIVLFVKLNGQKKRYDYFMGSNRRPTHNLEMKNILKPQRKLNRNILSCWIW